MARNIVISPEQAKELIGDEATNKLVGYMNDHWDVLQQTVDAFVNLLWPAVTALAAVGILSMALLEIWKALRHPRRAFQRENFEAWIKSRAAETGRDAEKALKNIVNLATAGNQDALYDLPVERFTGQVSAAVQMALAYPGRYPDIVGIMAHKAEPNDINTCLGPRPDPEDKAARQAHAEARNQVASLTQRSLDAIQIDIGNRWARGLHIRSVVVSSVLILIAAIWSSAGRFAEVGARDVVVWIVIAVVGGMVAPVARDLVTALKKVRDRQR